MNFTSSLRKACPQMSFPFLRSWKTKQAYRAGIHMLVLLCFTPYWITGWTKINLNQKRKWSMIWYEVESHVIQNAPGSLLPGPALSSWPPLIVSICLADLSKLKSAFKGYNNLNSSWQRSNIISSMVTHICLWFLRGPLQNIITGKVRVLREAQVSAGFQVCNKQKAIITGNVTKKL